MNRASGANGDGQPQRIEIGLRDISQLFNTIDPAPFHEKDQDFDAEEFSVSWVRKPMESDLYEWWPVRRHRKIYAKMSRMKVEVHQQV